MLKRGYMTEVWEVVDASPYNMFDKLPTKLYQYIRKVTIQIKDELHFQSNLKYLRVPITGELELICGVLKPDYSNLMDNESKFRGMTPQEIFKRTQKDPMWFRKNQDVILEAYKKGYAEGQRSRQGTIVTMQEYQPVDKQLKDVEKKVKS